MNIDSHTKGYSIALGLMDVCPLILRAQGDRKNQRPIRLQHIFSHVSLYVVTVFHSLVSVFLALTAGGVNWLWTSNKDCI